MSVLIRGMEMPQNCAECRMWCICECLNDFEDFESICYAVEDGDLVRDKNCPLVEIPTPHGRLKDESDIISLIEAMFCEDKDGMECAIQCVKDVDTVIEAEDGT